MEQQFPLGGTDLVPCPRGPNSPLRFKMADMQSFLFVSEFKFVDDFALTNDILEDNGDGMVVLAAVSSYTRRQLTCIHNYFEATIPRYLSHAHEFKNHFHHFRMTRKTCELLRQGVIQTGHIPVGNPHGRPFIAPEK